MRHPEYLRLIFTGPAPTATVAERALRACLTTLAGTHRIRSEVWGTVWHTPSGRSEDYKTVPLVDGSSLLFYHPEGKRILTWKERWGAR